MFTVDPQYDNLAEEMKHLSFRSRERKQDEKMYNFAHLLTCIREHADVTGAESFTTKPLPKSQALVLKERLNGEGFYVSIHQVSIVTGDELVTMRISWDNPFVKINKK